MSGSLSLAELSHIGLHKLCAQKSVRSGHMEWDSLTAGFPKIHRFKVKIGIHRHRTGRNYTDSGIPDILRQPAAYSLIFTSHIPILRIRLNNFECSKSQES